MPRYGKMETRGLARKMETWFRVQYLAARRKTFAEIIISNSSPQQSARVTSNYPLPSCTSHVYKHSHPRAQASRKSLCPIIISLATFLQ